MSTKFHCFKILLISFLFLSCNIFGLTSLQIQRLSKVLDALNSVSNAVNSSPLTPPSTPIAASSALGWEGGNLPGDWPATATSTASLSSWPVASIQNNTAVSCAGGLQTIYVALVNKANTGFLACQFQIQGNATLTALAKQGLYVAVQVSNVNASAGTSTVAVSLTDSAGNVFAQTAANLASNVGMTYINVGFNTQDTAAALTPPSGQAYVNWVPMVSSQRVYYQQSAANSASFGGITVPAGQVTAKTTPGLTPPSTPIAASSALGWEGSSLGSGDLPGDWPATATSTASLSSWPVASIQNNTAVSCAGGLQTIYVALVNKANTGFLACQFQIQGNATLTALAKQGLYVAVQVSNVNASAGTSTVAVSLTDSAGNVFAQTAANLASNVGMTYINVGFNTQNTTAALTPPSGQAYVNWVPIAGSQRIYYQQSAASASFGGITVPAGQSGNNGTAKGTPQSGSTIPFILASANINNACNFTAPGLSNSTSSAKTALSSTPFSCQGGLTEINIGLTDTTGCYLSFNFDSTILNQPAIQTLMQSGMYIGVNTIASSNSVVAVLMDVNNTVYAQGTAQLPAGTGGGIQAWNLGLNTSDSNVVNGSTQLGYNGIGLNASVLYQQLSTVSQPTGAVQAPVAQNSNWQPFGE